MRHIEIKTLSKGSKLVKVIEIVGQKRIEIEEVVEIKINMTVEFGWIAEVFTFDVEREKTISLGEFAVDSFQDGC